ncbi:MAG: hypothetical protein ACTSXT_13710 [Candidatus Helarchaeota archaeon]
MENKIYISFGQTHIHKIQNIVLDKDIILEVRNREQAYEIVKDKFAFSYTKKEIQKYLHFFPRGIVNIKGKKIIIIKNNNN